MGAGSLMKNIFRGHPRLASIDPIVNRILGEIVFASREGQ